jgi:hypothetical protein
VHGFCVISGVLVGIKLATLKAVIYRVIVGLNRVSSLQVLSEQPQGGGKGDDRISGNRYSPRSFFVPIC